MSSSAPPPPLPPGLPTALPFPPAPPQRPRPSAWWFALGGLLVVAGVAIGATALAVTIAHFTHVDATVADDGRAVPLRLHEGDSYLVWDHPGKPDSCSIVAAGTRQAVTTAGLGSSSYSRSGGSGSWEGVRTFTAPSGGVVVTCSADGGPIQIGPRPHLASFLGGIAVTVVAPLVLGLAGLAVLIVTTVLYVVRPSRGALPFS